MSEPAPQRRNISAAAPSASANPSSTSSSESTNIHQIMEDVNDKLKLLNYEINFLRKYPSLKPLSRLYFVVSTKPSEQFPYFSQLVSWLLHEIGVEVLEWNEFDDPNTISTSIVEQLRRLGYSPDFPASKLRHGSGDAVISSLDFLCDKCLSARGFQVQPPVHGAGEAEQAAVDDADMGGAEITDDVEEEAGMGGGSGSGHVGEEEDGVAVSTMDAIEAKLISHHDEQDEKSTAMLQSKVNPAEWALELERVGPLLKSRPAVAAKEWRTHLEHSSKNKKVVNETFPPVQSQLDKLTSTLKKSIERISAKERQINKEFEELGSEFRAQQKIYDTQQQTYAQFQASVAALTSEFQRVSDGVESIKQQMTDRNNSMTDTTPLRKVSTSLNQLKKEVGGMELRIGVLSQSLLHSKLKHHHQQQHAHHTHKAGASIRVKGSGDDYE